MTENDTSAPAEKISDDELLARVSVALDESETPFTRTKEVSSIVAELKTDQVRNRLKSLAEEEEQIAYTKSRGLVFWLPEGADDIGGEVDIDIATGDPDLEDITADQLPSELVEEAAELHEKRTVLYPNLSELSQISLQTGFYLFGFVFIMAFGEAFVLEDTLSNTWQDVVVAALVASVTLFVVHTLLAGFIKLAQFKDRHEDSLDRVNLFS